MGESDDRREYAPYERFVWHEGDLEITYDPYATGERTPQRPRVAEEDGSPVDQGRSRSSDMLAPMCYFCTRFASTESLSCSAFPLGIPSEIWEHRFDHRVLHPDQDNNLLFEPVDENAAQRIEYIMGPPGYCTDTSEQEDDPYLL